MKEMIYHSDEKRGFGILLCSYNQHVFLRETHMDNIIYNKKLYWFCYPNDIIGIVENVQDMQKTEK